MITPEEQAKRDATFAARRDTLRDRLYEGAIIDHLNDSLQRDPSDLFMTISPRGELSFKPADVH